MRPHKDVQKGSLWVNLKSSLWDSLWYSLRYRLRASLWYDLRDSLWDSLWDSQHTLLTQNAQNFTEKPP